MLLAFPGATVLWFDDAGIRAVPYQETEHYRIVRRFLENPQSYLRTLFSED